MRIGTEMMTRQKMEGQRLGGPKHEELPSQETKRKELEV